MAESDAPKAPTVTAVPNTPVAPTPLKITLPQETIRRWQDIVRQALLGGRDISVLVQQYAEQSFNTKLGALDVQGARRRMLARAQSALDRERVRALAHLEMQPSQQPATLTRSYTANSISVPGPQDSPPSATAGRGDKKQDIEWHHTTLAVEDPFTRRIQLEQHIQKLTSQIASIEKELPEIDAILNMGLRNQQNVVNELAAVSRELYRLAQEVQVELPVKKIPIDGSGYQKSVRKIGIGPSGSADIQDAGPSAPPADVQPQTLAMSTPVKTVPINPLVPASKHVARVVGRVSAQTSQLAAGIVTPVGHVIATTLSRVGGAISATLTRIVQATGAGLSAAVQKLKDIWPWRGPPPAP